jgi:hypothetical protein
MYLKNSDEEIHVINYRYSFSSFSNFKITNKLENNTVFYYQLNSEYFKEYCIYLEPKIAYIFEYLKIYTTVRCRFQSTPYI